MKSAVRRVLLLSALMSPNALLALGLGEIHLNSALNQPFDADIDLVSAADEDLSALRASLASNDTFVRYGLDKPAYLSDFTFRVVRGANGKDVLKVTSPRPVTEPFVTMLVEANWPRGRLLREYTVLLDPPVYAPQSQAAVAPVAAPRVSAPAPAPSPAPSGPTEPFAAAPPAPRTSPSGPAPSRPATTAPAAARSINAGSTYRVRPNDTLWKIASAAHPGSRSDVNRAMVSIYQSNPQAFDGNINVLKAGSLLKIPTASDVSAISASAAAAEVSRQYRLWREGVPASEGPEATSGRLRLVTPEQGTTAASTATAPKAATPAAPGAASPEVQSRVQQLEAELAEAKRLLEVRNAELATLQGQAAPPPGGAPAAAVPPAEPGAAATPAEGAPPAEAAAPPPAEVAPAPAPKPAVEAKKPVEEPVAGPSLVDRLMNYWWVLLGLLAAALAYLLYKRGRSAGGVAEDDLQEALARTTTTDLRARTATPRPRDSDIVVEERRPVEPAATPKPAPAPRAPEPSRRPVSIDDTLSGEAAVNIEAGDPLAEADFHMAYGLYDQAADLVQLAIKREPMRRDLKLKLLEIFFVWGNRDRFVDLAKEMNASRGDAQPGEWDKILIMGKQLAPDDALFAGTARPSAADLDMELHTSEGPLDMDLGADVGSATATDLDLTSNAALAPGEAGLDFVIDEPVRGADETSSVAPTVETPRLKARPSASDEPTQEVAIEELGIDVGELEGLSDLEGAETLEVSRPKAVVEDTVETPRPAGRAAEDEDEDMLSSTGILREQTGILRALEEGQGLDMDLSEATGELPTIETPKVGTSTGAVDFSLGEEAATMSEVGTKLDLARAYIDMGDPEGARSILDEVVKEGNAVQKQEAERLMASLP
jgi:pilus assembly protein FimV